MALYQSIAQSAISQPGAAAAAELDQMQVDPSAYVVWLSDGLEDEGAARLTERLRRFGLLSPRGGKRAHPHHRPIPRDVKPREPEQHQHHREAKDIDHHRRGIAEAKLKKIAGDTVHHCLKSRN